MTKLPRWLPESLYVYAQLIERYGAFEDWATENGYYDQPGTRRHLAVLGAQIDAEWRRAPWPHRAWANVCFFVEDALRRGMEAIRGV